MKKGIRLLAVLSAALFLLGGCGTPLYELTEEEEDLIVQGAAYMLSKYNIYQKDGMNSTLSSGGEHGAGGQRAAACRTGYGYADTAAGRWRQS